MTASQKDELLSLLLKEAGIGCLSTPAIAASGAEAALSFSQQRVWFLSRLEPQSSAYNVPIRIDISGSLDAARLEAALNAVLQRHHVLQSHFPERNGQPVQQRISGLRLPLPVQDLTALLEPERQARLDELTRDEAQAPFDLDCGPVIRWTLIKSAAETFRLLVTIHHIACDDWSMRVFVQDVMNEYRSAPLPPLNVQYSDVAAWQAREISGPRYAELLEYWRPRVQGIEAESGLLPDRARTRVRNSRAGYAALALSPELMQRVSSFSRGAGCTPYMTLLAALKSLSAACSGRSEAVVGTPVAGRHRDDVRGLVGFFVNTLVLRTAIERETPFTDILMRVRDTALDAFAHDEMPFELLVKEMGLERDLSSTPFFQIFFNMLPAEQLPSTEGLPFRIEEIDYCDTGASKFDLTLYVRERNRQTWVQAVYNAGIFEAGTIERLLTNYSEFLDAAVRNPEKSIGTLLSMLGSASDAVNQFNTPCEK
ncbi:MAG TPA: condensation domain-containing protein [Planctomycetota bacterium]|nr:condensation domain-containing protein [Planctomycetota bacterium]